MSQIIESGPMDPNATYWINNPFEFTIRVSVITAPGDKVDFELPAGGKFSLACPNGAPLIYFNEAQQTLAGLRLVVDNTKGPGSDDG